MKLLFNHLAVTSSDMSTAPSATTSSRFVSFSDYCQLVASTEQENNNPSNTTTTPELLNLLDETNNNSNFPIYPTTSKEGSLSRNRWDAIKLPTFTSTTGPVPPHTSTTSNTAPSASPFRWPTPNVGVLVAFMFLCCFCFKSFPNFPCYFTYAVFNIFIGLFLSILHQNSNEIIKVQNKFN